MGKTTLLRTLMGFVPAQRGRIAFDEVDVTREPPYARARRGLGYVPQGREIFPGLSVRDNLRMGFAGRGAEERIDAILADLPASHAPAQLAGVARSAAASSSCSPSRAASPASRR